MDFKNQAEAGDQIAEWNKNNPTFIFELVKEVRERNKEGDRV